MTVNRNTSATGGYLSEQDSIAGQGVEYRRFWQSVLVALSGLSPDLVRPAWQRNPPPIPSGDENWMAFGILRTVRDGANDAMVAEDSDGYGATLVRHVTDEMMLYFYGPDCLAYAEAVSDASQISQNQEVLRAESVAIQSFGEILHAPELVNERYIDRCDMQMTIRREVRKTYSVLSFLGADGEIRANRAVTTLVRQMRQINVQEAICKD